MTGTLAECFDLFCELVPIACEKEMMFPDPLTTAGWRSAALHYKSSEAVPNVLHVWSVLHAAAIHNLTIPSTLYG